MARLTEQQKNLIRIYYPVMKIKDLCEMLECTRSQVDWFVNKEGISRLEDDLMSYREISECLGISESAAYGACDRALKKMLAIIVNDDKLTDAFIEYLKIK